MFRNRLDKAQYLAGVNLGVDERIKLHASGNTVGPFDTRSPEAEPRLVPNVKEDWVLNLRKRI